MNIQNFKKKYPNLQFEINTMFSSNKVKTIDIVDVKSSNHQFYNTNDIITQFNTNYELVFFNNPNGIYKDELYCDILDLNNYLATIKDQIRYIIVVARYNNKYWLWNQNTTHIDVIDTKQLDMTNSDIQHKYLITENKLHHFCKSIKHDEITTLDNTDFDKIYVAINPIVEEIKKTYEK